MLKKPFFKWIGVFVIATLLVNLVLGVLSTVFPIEFLKPTEIIEGPRVFFNISLGNLKIPINQTIINTWVIMIILFLILFLGTRNLSVTNPGRMQVVLEDFYNFINDQFLGNFAGYKRTFMPLISALFSFLLLANLSSFLFPFVMMSETINGKTHISPFFRTATADINTTIGLAIIVTITFVGCGIYKKGILGVLKELSQPFIFLFPINLIGELAKPINISMRLFGNMFAGIVIMGLLYGISFNGVLASWTGDLLKGSVSFAVLWPAFLQLYLDLFIGVLQAFVFTVLSSVYIQQSLIDDEEI